MGKFSVTTSDRNAVDLEKTFSLDGTGTLLSKEKKEKAVNGTAFKDDIETLEEIQKLRQSRQVKATDDVCKKGILNKLETSEKTELVSIPAISEESVQMINALVHTQNYIVEELTDVFDKRLEKFDDIIMDLIRCKTENERLKQKVDNFTRENYKLKKDVESFKSIIPGIYIKKELDKTRF